MRSVLCLILSILILGCSPKIMPSTDTESIIIRDTVVLKEDTTVYVEVPRDSIVNVTKDTLSVLKTTISESTAEVIDGMLRHTLVNKGGFDITLTRFNVKVTTNESKTQQINTVRYVEKEFTKLESFFHVMGVAFTVLIVVVILGFSANIIIKRLK